MTVPSPAPAEEPTYHMQQLNPDGSSQVIDVGCPGNATAPDPDPSGDSYAPGQDPTEY